MKRVLVLGICGAGKSTLAKVLGHRLNLPVIHLDQHFWKPGWVESNKDEWSQKVDQLIKAPTWIMEGHYSSSFDKRFPLADTIIILNYNRFLALYRVTKRILQNYKKTRDDMAKDCPERFDWEFYKYMWNFNSNQKSNTQKALATFARPDVKVVWLKSPKQTKKFLRDLK